MSSIIASPAPAAPGAERLAEIRAAVEREAVALAGAAYLPPSHAMLRDLLAEVDRLTAALAEKAAPAAYPPALPWAAWLDADDLEEFLAELSDAASGDDDLNTLAEVESTCGTWRLIAEAHHAHLTAPGPNAAGLLAEQRHLMDPMDAAWVAMATRAEVSR
ncbi:hypothetical protein GCM10010406_21730 [Streptomyces thermolineatus]|uniref:Uncharacterized protein n=1 Tax=Streptomyces thermolineatus TaxID=44033 RepID=A0ABN3LM92_9ACTN